jgi:hypothetical protein
MGKLAALLQRLQRFTQLRQVLKGLFSAPVEKAMPLLDDRLLGSTSNAVERANHRYRKMQISIYRVRTYAHVVGRLALGLFRGAARLARTGTLGRLHAHRASP